MEAINDRREIESLVVLTGMSGSGKNTALRAFEDLGFFCVDNLPGPLVSRLVDLALAAEGRISKLAVVIDVRMGVLAADVLDVLRELRGSAHPVTTIFLDASDEILAQRYSETRRVHPLARNTSLLEGLKLEREKLSDVRARADLVIDTTDFTVHELKSAVYERFEKIPSEERLHVSLVSFGFKRGLPANADMVFDVRFLPNPHFEPGLREKTGEDPEIHDFLGQFEETEDIITRITHMLEYLFPRFSREGKSYLTVAIGCTGGRHRSVAVANAIQDRLQAGELKVNVIHRDLHLQ